MRRAALRRRGETMQDRQRERGGLAGAGLRDADQVAARHDDRDGLAWIGVGVTYFSSLRALRIASLRLKSLKLVNE